VKKSLMRTRLIGLFILAILLIVAWVFVLSPLSSKPEEIVLRTETALAQKESLQLQINDAKEKGRRMAKIEAKVRKFSEKFPSQIDPNSVQKAVRVAGAGAGIPGAQLTGITLGALAPYTAPIPGTTEPGQAAPAPAPSAAFDPSTVTPETVLQQPVTIVVNGTLNQIGQFTTQLSKGKRAFSVNSAVLAKSDGANAYSATITAMTFFLPPVGKAPTLPQAQQ